MHADGTTYKTCYTIMLPVDVRDATNPKFQITARLINSTELLITMPAMPFAFSHDSEERNDRLKDCGTYNLHLHTAQNIAHNAVSDNPNLRNKRLLLRFPNTVVLANVFDMQQSDELESDFQVDPVQFAIKDVHTFVNPCFMTWKVVDASTSNRYVLPAKKVDSVDKMVDQLKRMSKRQL